MSVTGFRCAQQREKMLLRCNVYVCLCACNCPKPAANVLHYCDKKLNKSPFEGGCYPTVGEEKMLLGELVGLVWSHL